MIENQEIVAFTNTEVIQELIFRFSRLEKISTAYPEIKKILQSVIHILAVSKKELIQTLKLIVKLKIDSRDAIHVSTMLNNGIKNIITADRHFDKIKGIQRIDPMDFKVVH